MVLWGIKEKGKKRKCDLISFHRHHHYVMRKGIPNHPGGGQDGKLRVMERSKWLTEAAAKGVTQEQMWDKHPFSQISQRKVSLQGWEMGIVGGGEVNTDFTFCCWTLSFSFPYFNIYRINFFFQDDLSVLCLCKYYRVHFIPPWIFISQFYVCHPH